MNILQVCAYAAPTPQNFINTMLQLESTLNSMGHTVVYAFPEIARDKDWCKKIEQKNKVYYLPLRKARVDITTYKTLYEIIKNNNIELAHSHFELYDVPLAVVGFFMKVKIFWHLHDAIGDIYNRISFSRKLLMKIQYKYLSKVSKVISCSEKHLKFIKKFKTKNDNLFFVPNGIDLNRITQVDRKNEKFTRYLMFGWEYERKAVDIACIAISNIGMNVKLTIVAGNDVLQKIRLLNLPQFENCIEVINSVADVNSLYRDNNCFLHISRAEGMSYALLEAIYSGTFVICSDIDENLFSKSFDYVTFVKTGDVDSLYEKIKYYYNNQINYEHYAFDKNRTIIEEKYSTNSWAKDICNLYFK